MTRSHPWGMCVLVALVVVPLVACGGSLDVPNPATLQAQANATALNRAGTPGASRSVPTPTTLTLTLGIPTMPANSAGTRPPATPNRTGGASGGSAAMGDTTLYTDAMNRFSLMRPKNWQETTQPDPSVIVVYVSASPQGVFNVLAKPVAASTTLDQYFNASVTDQKAQANGYQDGPIGAKQGQLGGEPARQTDYYATLSDTRSYFLQLYCIHKNTAYLLTFHTFVDPTSNDLNAFNRAGQVVTDSWKFL